MFEAIDTIYKLVSTTGQAPPVHWKQLTQQEGGLANDLLEKGHFSKTQFLNLKQ